MANPILIFNQGDNSPTIVVAVNDVNGNKVTDLSSYTGKLSIVENLGDTSLIVNDMTVVSVTETTSSGTVTYDTFQGEFTPAQSETLDVGRYITVAEIAQAADGFKQESHYSTVVNQQGYKV